MHHNEFGAHEVLEAHEVLTDTIDGINQFELYRPHVNDQQLGQILDRQVRFMHQEYQSLSTYMNQRRGVSPAIYQSRSGKQPIQYGLRSPSDVVPHHGAGRLDDRDVASGMMGCAKSSAVLRMNAALECADPTLRNMMIQGAISSAEQAYESFSYMNQRGMYQVPTMQSRTQATLMHTYHPPVGGMGVGRQEMMQPHVGNPELTRTGATPPGMPGAGIAPLGRPGAGMMPGAGFNRPS